MEKATFKILNIKYRNAFSEYNYVLFNFHLLKKITNFAKKKNHKKPRG